jgi:hypothetical protein
MAISKLYKFFYSIAWITEHFLGKTIKEILFSAPLRLLRQKNLQYLQKGSKGKKIDIIVLDTNQDDFEDQLQQLRKKNIPFIVRGVANQWDCLKSWSPQYFLEKYGDDVLPLINASPKSFNAEEVDLSVKYAKFSDIIQGMIEGNTELYSRFNDIFARHPELAKDVDKQWMIDRRDSFSNGKVIQCFMGAKGSLTHNHCATQSNYFVQVYGKKRWYLTAPKYNHYMKVPVDRKPFMHALYDPSRPDFIRFPEMEYADYYDFELAPGDIFYNPPCYWHHVVNPTMSIGFGFRWVSLQTFKSSPLQSFLQLFATNPSVLHALAWRGDFAKVFGFKQKAKQEV